MQEQETQTKLKQNKNLFLAQTRGFCAGVQRAIETVEETLKHFGPPVYVRHEIVHNHHVVNRLKKKGVVFIEELSEIPEDFIKASMADKNGQDDALEVYRGSQAPLIFSAHGVSKKVLEDAQKYNISYVDATCPLVIKIHKEAKAYCEKGFHVVLIGHANHPEIEGTIGQVPEGSITLVETQEQVKDLSLPKDKPLAYVTQTTLSVMDTKKIIEELQKKFPNIESPKKEDICYATTNRQKAVEELSGKVDAALVIGASHSSNSCRLVETFKSFGCKKSFLIENASQVPWEIFDQDEIKNIGVTASASAPEILVQELIDSFKNRYECMQVMELDRNQENIVFSLPVELRRMMKEKEAG